MGRPKGSKNRSGEDLQEEEHAEEKEEGKEEIKTNVLKEVLEPLGPGQKYFEAPDGTHIIGESDKQQIWYRKGNNGKGCFINPKR